MTSSEDGIVYLYTNRVEVVECMTDSPSQLGFVWAVIIIKAE